LLLRSAPSFYLLIVGLPPAPTLFPYTTLFRSREAEEPEEHEHDAAQVPPPVAAAASAGDDPNAPDERDETIARLERELEAERARSEEHTSELQSRENLVCRLLLEKKKVRQQED